MKKPQYLDSWPKMWKDSYSYDREEVFNEIRTLGYAYSYQNRQRHTLDLIKKYIPPGSRILDVAAAQGNFSILMAEAGYDVTWNDLRADLVDYVKQKHEFGKLSYEVGDVFGLGFDNCFDAVLITEIIEHVAHPDLFLSKIAAMVKPGGHIVMTTPNGGYCLNRLPRFLDCPDPSKYESVQFKPNSDGHIFLLWPDEIVQLGERSGLELLNRKFFTNLLTAGHLKTRFILKIAPRSFVFLCEKLISLLPKCISRKVLMHTAVCYKRTVCSG